MNKIETISVDDMYRVSKLIDSAVEARIKHVEQSPKTERQFTKVEDSIRDIKTSCNSHNTNNEIMKRDINEIKKYIAEDLQWKKDFEAKMEKSFAKKWVEKIVAGLLIIFALAALWSIFDSVGLPH